RRRRPARTASAQAHALRPAEESLEPLGDRGREAHHAAEDERDPVPRLPDEGVLHGHPRSATAARRPKEARRVDLVGHALRAQALRQGGSDRAPAPRRDRGLCRNRALQRPLGGNQWQGAPYHATVLRPSFCLSPYRADPSLLLRPHAAARSHHPALPPNLMESRKSSYPPSVRVSQYASAAAKPSPELLARIQVRHVFSSNTTSSSTTKLPEGCGVQSDEFSPPLPSPGEPPVEAAAPPVPPPDPVASPPVPCGWSDVSPPLLVVPPELLGRPDPSSDAQHHK